MADIVRIQIPHVRYKLPAKAIDALMEVNATIEIRLGEELRATVGYTDVTRHQLPLPFLEDDTPSYTATSVRLGKKQFLQLLADGIRSFTIGPRRANTVVRVVGDNIFYAQSTTVFTTHPAEGDYALSAMSVEIFVKEARGLAAASAQRVIHRMLSVNHPMMYVDEAKFRELFGLNDEDEGEDDVESLGSLGAALMETLRGRPDRLASLASDEEDE